MSKPIENAILVPGESGWEIWTGQTTLTLHAATTIERASDLTDIPSGELLLLFPVRAITVLPMSVTSEDDALFPDLAALHAERLGLRLDPMARQLSDVFVIARQPENTALCTVILRPPAEGEMPPRGPKSFDISPRAYPLTGDALALWKEFGRWVFAISHQGNLVYCQATSATSTSPDATLAREVRLALIQLAMQGMEIEPAHIALWTSHPDTIDSSALTTTFRAPIQISPRPAPTLPAALSKLLPADVRAARRQAKQRQNIFLAAAAAIALYLGIIGWFAYGLWKDHSATQTLIAQAKQAAPESAAFTRHQEKWDELADAINLKNSPVDILSRISTCIPPNSGLRLKIADISAIEVKLTGEAPQLPAVNSFSLNLGKNPSLAHFTWEKPEPNQSTRGWEFQYTGQIPIPTP